MVAKRFFNNESEADDDHPPHKRTRPRPSFASIIGEVVMVNSLQHLCSALEPLLRKVVREEVDHVLRRCSNSFTKSPSFRLQTLEPSRLHLTFSNKLLLPIFTGSKIVDAQNCPLQILLIDTINGDRSVPVALPNTIKVEIVVLDGDFPAGGRDSWTSDEFNQNIVRERTGKRPLLAGDLNVTMRDGFAPIGDVEFTDNSSWIRSRKFRLGARVVSRSYEGVKIGEAMTDSFVVKDHRGELYKKHHPPSLEDDVWRLEKIGKEGAFHKKLSSEGINTVQDFLKLSVVDPPKLRRILGAGMSEKMWETTIKHARECVIDSKLYISRGHNYIIFLNPICQVVRAMIDGHIYPTRELSIFNRGDIDKLVKEAYANWDSLEEVDGAVNETPLLTQGEVVDQYPNHHQDMVKLIRQNGYQTDKSIEVGYLVTSNDHPAESSNWHLSSTYVSSTFESGFRYGVSEETSDGNVTPLESTFINGV